MIATRRSDTQAGLAMGQRWVSTAGAGLPAGPGLGSVAALSQVIARWRGMRRASRFMFVTPVSRARLGSSTPHRDDDAQRTTPTTSTAPIRLLTSYPASGHQPGGAVKRKREDLGIGLVLGFAAGVVASLISIPVVLEVLERLPAP